MTDFLDSLKDIKKELIKEQKPKENESNASKEKRLLDEFAEFIKDSDIKK